MITAKNILGGKVESLKLELKFYKEKCELLESIIQDKQQWASYTETSGNGPSILTNHTLEEKLSVLPSPIEEQHSESVKYAYRSVLEPRIEKVASNS